MIQQEPLSELTARMKRQFHLDVNDILHTDSYFANGILFFISDIEGMVPMSDELSYTHDELVCEELYSIISSMKEDDFETAF